MRDSSAILKRITSADRDRDVFIADDAAGFDRRDSVLIDHDTFVDLQGDLRAFILLGQCYGRDLADFDTGDLDAVVDLESGNVVEPRVEHVMRRGNERNSAECEGQYRERGNSDQSEDSDDELCGAACVHSASLSWRQVPHH